MRRVKAYTLLILFALALLLLSGCDTSTLPGPTVYVDLGEALNMRPLLNMPTAWNTEDMKWIWCGMSAWRKLGFDVRPLGEPINGALDPSQVVVIQLFRDRGMQEANQFSGLSDRGTGITFINAGMTTFSLCATVMHELGHQLLNTALHLPPNQGVMSPASLGWNLTEADFAFACQVAGRCTRF
jgi:hypothetical protein